MSSTTLDDRYIEFLLYKLGSSNWLGSTRPLKDLLSDTLMVSEIK